MLNNYIKDTTYKVVFPYSSDSSLLLSKSGEVASQVRGRFNKKIFFFPDVKDKSGFLAELFTSVFPTGNYGFISDNLSDYGDFKWINELPYVSYEERNLIIKINNEKFRHAQALRVLESSLS